MSIGIRTVAVLLTILCSACGVAPSATEPTSARENFKAYCQDLLAGLPTTDPMFDLKGRISTQGFEKFTHEIAQFGKKGIYREYFVIADASNGASCGYIPLYRISKAEYLKDKIAYRITLKNSKSFETRTNIPFGYRAPDSRRVFTVLVGGLDEEKDSWLWYITIDSRFK
jgi:hypothetical protein